VRKKRNSQRKQYQPAPRLRTTAAVRAERDQVKKKMAAGKLDRKVGKELLTHLGLLERATIIRDNLIRHSG
jgi:hypothetical protein